MIPASFLVEKFSGWKSDMSRLHMAFISLRWIQQQIHALIIFSAVSAAPELLATAVRIQLKRYFCTHDHQNQSDEKNHRRFHVPCSFVLYICGENKAHPVTVAALPPAVPPPSFASRVFPSPSSRQPRHYPPVPPSPYSGVEYEHM